MARTDGGGSDGDRALYLTIAMRTGEVGVVTPFRYTRLIFAMIAGIVIFGEPPDL